MSNRIDARQRALFAALSQANPLIFAAGPRGISANLVGDFAVRAYAREDRLDVGDGTHHVHVDWSRVRRAESGTFHGEGLLTFFDGEELLFKLYRPAGPYPPAVCELAGTLQS